MEAAGTGLLSWRLLAQAWVHVCRSLGPLQQRPLAGACSHGGRWLGPALEEVGKNSSKLQKYKPLAKTMEAKCIKYKDFSSAKLTMRKDS